MKKPDYEMPVTFDQFCRDPRAAAVPPLEKHMPRCDGKPWPEISTVEAVERQQIEFLSAYSHLNRLHDSLHEIRRAGLDGEAPAIVDALQRLIGLRDQLEDRYAPFGFYAEPVMEDHLAVNLIFHYAQKYVDENHRKYIPMDVSLKVPVPENKNIPDSAAGIPAETIRADLKLPWRGGDSKAPAR
jgi:hypothetical protein